MIRIELSEADMPGESFALIHVPRAKGFETLREAVSSLSSRGEVMPGGEFVFRLSESGGGKLFLDGVPSEISEWVYLGEAPSLEEALLKEAVGRGLRVAAVESCTGGLVMERCTSVPGSSAYFWGGVVAYSDEAKKGILGVDPEILSACGAVSREAVESMVRGMVKISGADLAVAVSGIAGPEGGTPEKPVGTVWLSVGGGSTCRSEKLLFYGDREEVRWAASSHALWMLLAEVAG